jgi:hypothetical protein
MNMRQGIVVAVAGKPCRRRSGLIAACVALPLLLVGVAATTRAVLDLDLWRHSGQRARDLLASPAATAQDRQHAITAIQLDAMADVDALQEAARRDDEAGRLARVALLRIAERSR